MSVSLRIAFRKVASTEALKSRIEKRVVKFEKYVSYPMEVDVRVSLEGNLHVAEISCHAEHRILVAVTKTKDLYEAIDLAAHKIDHQLKKKREKRKGHQTAHRVTRRAAARLATDVEAEIPHGMKRVKISPTKSL